MRSIVAIVPPYQSRGSAFFACIFFALALEGCSRLMVKTEIYNKAINGEGADVQVLSDVKVPFIVNASEDKWQGIYNYAWSRTLFGNSEIAIRMENLGESHIKGVMFDPSRVTKATFDGLATAVKVAAAAYGVPLPTNGGSGADPTTLPTGIEDSQSTTSVSKARLRAETEIMRQRIRERLSIKAKLFLKLAAELQKTDEALTESVENLKMLVDEDVKTIEAKAAGSEAR